MQKAKSTRRLLNSIRKLPISTVNRRTPRANNKNKISGEARLFRASLFLILTSRPTIAHDQKRTKSGHHRWVCNTHPHKPSYGPHATSSGADHPFPGSTPFSRTASVGPTVTAMAPAPGRAEAISGGCHTGDMTGIITLEDESRSGSPWTKQNGPSRPRTWGKAVVGTAGG